MNVINTAWGILGSRLLRRPFYGRVHVTYRCNYRCRMCGIRGNHGRFAELPPDRLAVVAERLWECDIPFRQWEKKR